MLSFETFVPSIASFALAQPQADQARPTGLAKSEE
jgi:hypothetical protein